MRQRGEIRFERLAFIRVLHLLTFIPSSSGRTGQAYPRVFLQSQQHRQSGFRACVRTRRVAGTHDRRREPQLLRGVLPPPLLLVQPLGLRGSRAEQPCRYTSKRADAQREGARPNARREAVQRLHLHPSQRARARRARRARHGGSRRAASLYRRHVTQADGGWARRGERGDGGVVRDEDAEHAALRRQVVERRVCYGRAWSGLGLELGLGLGLRLGLG